MRPHIPEDELHAFLDAQLSPVQRAEIAEHLLACLICRALEGEVRSLRTRSRELLALATPPEIRGIPLPARRPRYKLRTGRVAAIAAAALVVAGSWSFTRTGGTAGGEGRPVLASVFVAPAILARVVSPAAAAVDSVVMSGQRSAPISRTLTLASRAAVAPRVIPVRQVTGGTASRRLRVMDPMLEAAPSATGEGWETTSFQEAREAASGAVAHLDGIPVNTVRLQPSGRGGRPTAMVRQLLPDGRVVWVVEGAIEELGPVYQMLEASGLSLSTPRRARPDYIGTDEAPIRTVRMVTVAAYLSRDSVEALAGSRLKVD